jgi:hypothetical protein
MSMQDQTTTSPVQAALRLGPIQVVVLALVALVAIVGAIVSFVSPSSLSFNTYSTQVIPELVAGLGILGIGKGLHLGLAGRAEQKALTDAPDILKAMEHGQVAAALALAQADFQTEPAPEPGETLPGEEEMAASPPPPDPTLPPLPEPIPGAGPDRVPGTGLAADDAGVDRITGSPPVPSRPSAEEVAGARRILSLAQQQPTGEDIAVARDVLRRAQS